jgi:hypothetical protein
VAVLVIGSKYVGNLLVGTNDGLCVILGSNSTTCGAVVSLPSEVCLTMDFAMPT